MSSIVEKQFLISWEAIVLSEIPSPFQAADNVLGLLNHWDAHSEYN